MSNNYNQPHASNGSNHPRNIATGSVPDIYDYVDSTVGMKTPEAESKMPVSGHGIREAGTADDCKKDPTFAAFNSSQRYVNKI